MMGTIASSVVTDKRVDEWEGQQLGRRGLSHDELLK
jgi:hypothetical protein